MYNQAAGAYTYQISAEGYEIVTRFVNVLNTDLGIGVDLVANEVIVQD